MNPISWLFSNRRFGERAGQAIEPSADAVLLSASQMEQHGIALAKRHRLAEGRSANALLPQLLDNAEVLAQVCQSLKLGALRRERMAPAAEWLIDNFHVIDDHVRTATRHLPKRYSQQLPALADQRRAKQPRVYAIALEHISHGDGRVDAATLGQFVAAYQSVSQLTLGELWAVPIMLRLGLLAKLRRVAAHVGLGHAHRHLAGHWASRMIEGAESDPKSLVLLVADMSRSNPPMTTAFVAEFARRLQGQSAALALPLTWIEQLLADAKQSIGQMVQLEARQQASAQVSVSNCIGSLQQLSEIDWNDFVETHSVVEHTLRSDPAGVYAAMDFATRDRYRHVVEDIGRQSGVAEPAIAAHAVHLAERQAALSQTVTGAPVARAAHVGYFLIDAGRRQLWQAIGVKPPWDVQYAGVTRGRLSGLLAAYLGPLWLVTVLMTAAMVVAWGDGESLGVVLAMMIALLLVTSQAATAAINLLATLLFKPQLLPSMDYSRGVPEAAATLVIVPTLLTSAAQVEDLVEALEVRFLANRDANIYFGLLTDVADAATEVVEGDAALIALAHLRVQALNETYCNEPAAGAVPVTETGRFFLFHRPRCWNASERLWMGHERKRGKLSALNQLLLGAAEPSAFSHIVGDLAKLRAIRYMITLDTDTQLPRDAARDLVGVAAHPLNRPVFGSDGNTVVAGYTILQPRVSASLPGTHRTGYARLLGSDAGVDPYTRAVSDVYQDVFGEGSFIGKGIYEIDAFERALHGRLPNNRILSHDLLEGCFARCALVSDVQLYDDVPSHYLDDANRRHRWIRGDWQIAAWAMPKVPAFGATNRTRNELTLLSQWKLLDNLRRSLVAPAWAGLLMFSWHASPAPGYLTVLLVLVCLAPQGLGFVSEALRRASDVLRRDHVVNLLRSARQQLALAVLTLACLPFEAYYSADAIVRSLWRMGVSKTRRLEWTPSPTAGVRASANAGLGAHGLVMTYRRMWVGPALALLEAVVLAWQWPHVAWVAAPLLLLWAAAPALVWWLGRAIAEPCAHLSNEQAQFLHASARRTWAFFERFVGPKDNWLPPDNYQEAPVVAVAHRTSPTNIGMALLANLAAHDFGYLSTSAVVYRTERTLATLVKLDRYAGHFYNWYDTLSLKPLPPLYVSTVDSGNLAGHLITLKRGLLGLLDEPIHNPCVLEGLADALAILEVTLKRDLPPRARVTASFRTALAEATLAMPLAPTHLFKTLQSLQAQARSIGVALHVSDARSPNSDEVEAWSQALIDQCDDAVSDLTRMLPWLAVTNVPQRLRAVMDAEAIPTLQHACAPPVWLMHVQMVREGAAATPIVAALAQAAVAGCGAASQRVAAVNAAAREIDGLLQQDYAFLYNKVRRVLAVGFNATTHMRDPGHYDMLGSEARLGTFVAIAQGQLPQESWFALGRTLVPTPRGAALLSWSGSMFEYLMPRLVMPTYRGTLLESTYQSVVAAQVAHGQSHGIAWGVSESGYNAFDAVLNYQYRAFGIPSLGLKPGLADDLIIAPYASALALLVTPEAACSNLQRLANEGMMGRYGFYEAVDFTPSRLPRGKSQAIVMSYMAHHVGMSLLALVSVLRGQPMQRRFESEPLVRATLPLLHERVPKQRALGFKNGGDHTTRAAADEASLPIRVINTADTARPEVHLLSNGRYHVMVTNAGGGSSRWNHLALTRWREDTTRDNWGWFCYLRDVASGAVWSNAHQPTLQVGNAYEAIFSVGRAEFRRSDQEYETHTEIAVSPEDDIELRRIRVTNRANARRSVEITTYAEAVLGAAQADAAHPAFSNLFVQTEVLSELQAVLCTRRPRSPTETSPMVFQLMAVHGAHAGAVSYETDRMRFIGRGKTPTLPEALERGGNLSGTAGSVLDPVIAMRTLVVLEAQEFVTIDLVMGVAPTRHDALKLIEKYRDRRLADRVFELAWTHGQVALRQINATDREAHNYSRLAASILYANSPLRSAASTIAANRRSQSGLWGYAISGDLPIVLLRISDGANIELVRQLVKAHAYWRLKGLAVDLVIWNEDHAGYRQLLQEKIAGLIAAGAEARYVERPGGIFLRLAEHIGDEDRTLFEAVACAVLSDKRGTLAEQVRSRQPKLTPRGPSHARKQRAGADSDSATLVLPADLLFANGLGGFAADGQAYWVMHRGGQKPPLPWANVLANPQFGAVVTDSGCGYTWFTNAHEYRLTPWENDAVADASGEAFYLRDEDTNKFWSPTPQPSQSENPYLTSHGFGYSIFKHCAEGIDSVLTTFVAIDAPVKYFVLRLHNQSSEVRRLAAFGYVEWVLGNVRSKTAAHVVTELDLDCGALTARNVFNVDFAEHVAFFDVNTDVRTFTCDRAEFIGRNNGLGDPAALAQQVLSNTAGAGRDPCAALQVAIELAPGETREWVFRLGAGANLHHARQVVKASRGSTHAHDALVRVKAHWAKTLGAVQIQTPDAALDLLTNGWLIYQTLACRLWARSGFYQSGGAFGFRDQLQDVMALLHTTPALAREHILVCASRQFTDGDVQHWWHPPRGRGVRTRCSDDFLWLPLAVCRYVRVTGDAAVMDEPVPFLEGQALADEAESRYDLPGSTVASETLYQHCVRAIRRGAQRGQHGLPLIGSGDWNDGMNLVGAAGKGESVWLGFFTCQMLADFAQLARQRDSAFADECVAQRAALVESLEQHGWDGQWYRRAYFDDGTPLGSAQGSECRIDSIAQSWAVLSGAGAPERMQQAMQAVDTYLVRPQNSMMCLLDPPFDRQTPHPGYIRGYVPGVRENGGQYTHGAVWAAMAFAQLGDAERAWDLTSMINPINHARTLAEAMRYRTEPYVMAADVYAAPPHTGRGGWTWYTGSAAWMYRLILESLLGVRKEAARLYIEPRLPGHWPGFSMTYVFGRTRYCITVARQMGPPTEAPTPASLVVDGVGQPRGFVTLVDDQNEHVVQVGV